MSKEIQVETPEEKEAFDAMLTEHQKEQINRNKEILKMLDLCHYCGGKYRACKDLVTKLYDAGYRKVE